jgi:hypothetical protein
MKTILLGSAILFSVALNYSCNKASARYIDLETGEVIELDEDRETGLMVDKATREPVKIYVDTERRDTIWGLTGDVINGKLVEVEKGKWKYEGEDGEYKAEREKDGDYKIKAGEDVKVKYENGEYKEKRGEHYKKEIEKDGDITIKDGNKKIKIDGETGKRKVKVDD